MPSGPLMLLRPKTLTWPLLLLLVSTNFLFYFLALIIGIVVTAIYLSVKPESTLIKQFFFVILVSQVFNFDMVPTTMCGMLGTIFSIMSSSVSLIYMPEVIKTRDVSTINLPMRAMNCLNYFIWTLVAIWINDGFMMVS